MAHSTQLCTLVQHQARTWEAEFAEPVHLLVLSTLALGFGVNRRFGICVNPIDRLLRFVVRLMGSEAASGNGTRDPFRYTLAAVKER